MAAVSTAPSRSRFLISESALKLSLTPAPSTTPTGSVSSASSSSSSSSSSFAVRRKQFRPTSVPADQPRVHSESPSLVSLGIVLVVSGAPPDPYVRRPLKRPFRAIDREPKERDGQPREQPRYRPPPPDVPLPTRRRLRTTHALTRQLPLYHPSRPLRDLPPLPTPVDVETVVPEPQATRSSGRTRRPPPRNLEHLIVAVSNTARQRESGREKDKDKERERSPAKKRKVVVLATDEMDIEVEVRATPTPTPTVTPTPAPELVRGNASRSAASKKKVQPAAPIETPENTPPVEEADSGRGARRATRRGGKDVSVTPTPPPTEAPAPAPKSSRSRSAQQPLKPKSQPTKVTRRNSDETATEETDASESVTKPAPAPKSASRFPPRRTSARRSGGMEQTDDLPVSVRA